MNWRARMLQWWNYAAKRWKRIYRDDVYVRLFALVLALVLWFLAGAEEHVGVVERVVTAPVQVENLSEQYALTVAPDPVQVRIRGITPLMTLAERDTDVTVDLGNASEGSGTYSVRVSVPTGVEVVSVSPRWVGLEVESIVEDVYPVTLAFVGLPEGQALRVVEIEPVQVAVSGRRSVMAQVAQVVVYVPSIGTDSSFEGDFAPHALDVTGRVLTAVSFEPNSVSIRIENEESGEDTER